MENKYILCIDLGTSGPKVALVNMLGEVLIHEFEPTQCTFFPTAERTEARRLVERRQECCKTFDRAASRAGTRYYCHLRHQPVVHDGGGRQKRSPIDERDFMDGYARGKIHQRHHGWTNKIEGYGITKLLAWLSLTGGIRDIQARTPLLTFYTSKMNCRIFIGTLINSSNQKII